MDVVPVTSSEALQMFLKSLEEKEKKEFKQIDEDDIFKFHHTWGREMRNAWSMSEKNTPLVNCFKTMGITHPDDMSTIILRSAHRQLNKQPIKLTDQIKKHQEYWMKHIGKKMP